MGCSVFFFDFFFSVFFFAVFLIVFFFFFFWFFIFFLSFFLLLLVQFFSVQIFSSRFLETLSRSLSIIKQCPNFLNIHPLNHCCPPNKQKKLEMIRGERRKKERKKEKKENLASETILAGVRSCVANLKEALSPNSANFCKAPSPMFHFSEKN